MRNIFDPIIEQIKSLIENQLENIKRKENTTPKVCEKILSFLWQYFAFFFKPFLITGRAPCWWIWRQYLPAELLNGVESAT